MQRRLALFLLALALALTGCEQAKPPEPPAAPPKPEARAQPVVELEHAAFGVFNQTPDGRIEFTPSKTVPLKPDQAFGWIIGVKTTKPTVKWREKFTLPAPPETWGPTDGKHEISADRKISILEREVAPEMGQVFNSWIISPGDPKGHHVIEVTIEDARPVVFEFDIE
jgi:hypothetical protein